MIQSSIFCQVPLLKWPRLFTLFHIYYRTWFVDREGSTIHSFFARDESSCRQSSVISSLKGSNIRTQVIYSLFLHPSQGVLRFNSISSIALTVFLSSPLRWSSHFRLIWRLYSSCFKTGDTIARHYQQNICHPYAKQCHDAQLQKHSERCSGSFRLRLPYDPTCVFS